MKHTIALDAFAIHMRALALASGAPADETIYRPSPAVRAIGSRNESR